MSSNFGDNSTVVGDPAYKRTGESTSKESSPHLGGFHTSTGKSRMNEFTTVDYTIQERPFFIPIGKDGVIAALEKLDKQLQDVTSLHF